MPQFRPLLTAATLIVLGAGPLMAQAPAPDAPPPPPIGHHGMKHPGPMAELTVTGEGQSTAQPDLATVSLGVSSRADTAAEAMSQNAAQQTKVIDALKGAGVEARDIQTSGLNLSPVIDYQDGQPPKLTGYAAQNMVTVRVRDIAGLGPVLDKLVGAGANEINGIGFSREDMTEALDKARADAIADARHRAEVMAEAAGMRLGPLMSLSEAQIAGGPQPMMMAADAKRGGAPIEAGELSVTANVTAVFAMHDAKAPKPGPEGEDAGAPPPPPAPGDAPAPADAPAAPAN